MPAKKLMKKRKSENGKGTTNKITPKKIPVIKEPLSKSSMMSTIADATNVAKRDVNAVFDALIQLIEGHIKSRGPGIFVLPGMLKIMTVKKPARPARKGINPFTKEE